eukprot:2682490-Amphidinium_carterae.1
MKPNYKNERRASTARGTKLPKESQTNAPTATCADVHTPCASALANKVSACKGDEHDVVSQHV